MTYNYQRFDDCVADGSEAREFAAFRDHFHVGGPAPDATLTRLEDGRRERLSDREAFYQRLRRNGQRAYEEFKRAEQIWRQRT